MTLDIEKIKAAALDVFAPSVPNAEVLELITRLEELQELYASSAFNTNYWKAKAEAAEKDAAKYFWLCEKHAEGDEQWFVYGARTRDMDSEIDAAMKESEK